MQLYKISFPPEISRKAYIGISAKSALHRFKQHCASRKKYPIVLALKKYGPENAILEILGEFHDHDELYAAEQKAILSHGTKAPNGFNLTDGGKGAFGCAASEERKRKISAANTGRKLSAEHRAAISANNKLRDMSAQVSAMAIASKGKKLSEDHLAKLRSIHVGRKHSEESKRRMSESASKRRASEETKLAISIGMKKSRARKKEAAESISCID